MLLSNVYTKLKTFQGLMLCQGAGTQDVGWGAQLGELTRTGQRDAPRCGMSHTKWGESIGEH